MGQRRAEEDLGSGSVRPAYRFRLRSHAMSPQHPGRRVETADGDLPDRAHHHPLGADEKRQRLVDGTRGLARAVPSNQDRPAELGRGWRWQHQHGHA